MCAGVCAYFAMPLLRPVLPVLALPTSLFLLPTIGDSMIISQILLSWLDFVRVAGLPSAVFTASRAPATLELSYIPTPRCTRRKYESHRFGSPCSQPRFAYSIILLYDTARLCLPQACVQHALPGLRALHSVWQTQGLAISTQLCACMGWTANCRLLVYV